jgi:hypothetical protein
LCTVLSIIVPASASAEVVTFDDNALAPNSYWNGPDPSGTTVTGPYGTPEVVGSFTSNGVSFGNTYDTTYGVWGGFAYSNMGDTTTAGFGNQYSAYTGTGRGEGQDNYGVAFGSGGPGFDPTDIAQLGGLPHLQVPIGENITGAYLTNTTYSALSMLNGDGFSDKFGDTDFFKVTIYGSDSKGMILSSSKEFFLADFRTPGGTAADHVVSDWTFVDLSGLKGAQTIYFSLSSSSNSIYGMNNPAYFAIDDISFAPETAPEPTSLALLLVGGIGMGCARRFRKRV